MTTSPGFLLVKESIFQRLVVKEVSTHSGFSLEKSFRGDETKFSRNAGIQAKIHKIYVVHTLSTCTSFSMLKSGLAPVLIRFKFFFNNLLDEDLAKKA